MEKQTALTFWGNISHIRMADGASSAKIEVVIKSSRFSIARTDPAISFLKVTSGGKNTFVVVEPMQTEGMCRVLAVYGPSKANHRLVLGIREQLELGRGRSTLQDLADWDPDYLYRPPQDG